MTTARVSGTFLRSTYMAALFDIFPKPWSRTDDWVWSTYNLWGRNFRYLADAPYTKAQWDSVRWSNWRDALGPTTQHSGAPKPSWETMLKALVKVEHRKLAGDGERWQPGTVNDDLHARADELAESAIAVPGHGSVIAPEGRAFAALIHLHDRRGEAGFPMRESRAQNTDGEIVSIRTREALTRYITGVALSRDLLHSAANEVQGDVTVDLAKMVKSSLTGASREAAYWRILDIEADMRGAVKAKVQALVLSTDAPADHDLAREFQVERVETTGAAQRREVMGAATQQGMWEEGGCTAMSRTLTRIAEAVQAGVREVWRAANPAAMKTAADTAITTITGLTESGGGPAWYEHGSRSKITGGALAKQFTFDSDATTPQAVATVVAHPPSAEARESNCAITGIDADPGFSVALSVPSGTGSVAKRHQAVVTYSGEAAPAVGKGVRLVARNACGPSTLSVSVAAPTRPPSE